MQASECLKCFTTSQLVVVLPIGGTAIAIPLKFHNYLLLLCCLLFHLELSFHIVQFSRCAFQPLLRSDFSIQIPLGTEIRSQRWWAKVDSNHRPHDYQSCALAS